MKKSLQIQINKPCHENWENMQPAVQGRFCGSCEKTVVDFTNMTDEELLTWLTRPGKEMCGRFKNDQLQRDLFIHPKRTFSFRYIWQLMIASFLLVGEAEGQLGEPVLVENKIKKLPADDLKLMGTPIIAVEKSVTISGSITDSSNNTPISQASVIIKGTSKGVVSDSTGKFVIEYDGDQKQIELEVSSIGYNLQSLIVDRETNYKALNISLSHSDAVIMGEVSVVAYPVMGKVDLTGAITLVCTGKPTIVQQLSNYFNDLSPSKKEIVVYPNPVSPGSSINFSLDLKEAGQYKLELTDASGRLFLSKSITIGNVKQQESLTTVSSWSRGIYYLRISQPGKKFNKTTKVLLQ